MSDKIDQLFGSKVKSLVEPIDTFVLGAGTSHLWDSHEISVAISENWIEGETLTVNAVYANGDGLDEKISFCYSVKGRDIEQQRAVYRAVLARSSQPELSRRYQELERVADTLPQELGVGTIQFEENSLIYHLALPSTLLDADKFTSYQQALRSLRENLDPYVARTQRPVALFS